MSLRESEFYEAGTSLLPDVRKDVALRGVVRDKKAIRQLAPTLRSRHPRSPDRRRTKPASRPGPSPTAGTHPGPGAYALGDHSAAAVLRRRRERPVQRLTRSGKTSCTSTPEAVPAGCHLARSSTARRPRRSRLRLLNLPQRDPDRSASRATIDERDGRTTSLPGVSFDVARRCLPVSSRHADAMLRSCE